MIECGGELVAHIKVVWSGMDDSLATWEDVVALCSRFPEAPAWGQAVFQGGGGNVDSGAAQADETEGNHNLNTDEEKAREV